MSAWLLSLLAMLPVWAAACAFALYGSSAKRLVAFQFAATMTALLLMLWSAAVVQPSFIDLALAFVFVGYPGTLIYTHFLERWL